MPTATLSPIERLIVMPGGKHIVGRKIRLRASLNAVSRVVPSGIKGCVGILYNSGYVPDTVDRGPYGGLHDLGVGCRSSPGTRPGPRRPGLRTGHTPSAAEVIRCLLQTACGLWLRLDRSVGGQFRRVVGLHAVRILGESHSRFLSSPPP